MVIAGAVAMIAELTSNDEPPLLIGKLQTEVDTGCNVLAKISDLGM